MTARQMIECRIRDPRPGDEQGADYVCLKTGDNGDDGEPFFGDDPDALGRIFVGPYLAFEPELALILEDGDGHLRLRAGRVRLARVLCPLRCRLAAGAVRAVPRAAG